MWLAELLQCIECGSDDYFVWILPFFFACTSLPSSLVFRFLVQVARLTPPEENSFLGLILERSLLRPLFSGSHLRVGSSLMWVWALLPPQIGSTGYILYSDLNPPTVCMYNFYLNKLFKLFILLKEIIMIIKTHIKLIMNMYYLFSKFYWRERERETTCDGEL